MKFLLNNIFIYVITHKMNLQVLFALVGDAIVDAIEAPYVAHKDGLNSDKYIITWVMFLFIFR